MSNGTGVSLEDFTQAVIESYKKGFDDAIECLKTAQTTIKPEEMKKSIKEMLSQQGKLKTEW